MNQAGLAMLEAESLDDIKGKPVLPLIAPEDQPRFRQLHEAAMRGKSGSLEFSVVTLRGRRRVLETIAVPLRRGDGEIFAALGITRDVTEKRRREQELRQTNQRLEVLCSANLALGESLELQQVLSRLLVWLRQLVPYDSANVMLLEEGRMVVHAAYGYDAYPGTTGIVGLSFDAGKPKFRLLVEEKKPIIIADTLREPRWERPQQSPHVRSWMGVPLVAGGRLIGLFSVDKTTPGFFTPQHAALAESLAPQAAVAIENARMFARLRQQAEELDHSAQELRALAAHLQSVREEERTDLARDVHDDLGQKLTALRFDLMALAKNLKDAPVKARKRVESAQEVADAALQTVRQLSTRLRPALLEDFGLAAALEWEGQQFQERTKVRCVMQVDPGLKLERERATALFRIVQECLTNVSRHARARSVSVRLSQSSQAAVLEVADDGVGLEMERLAQPGHFGVLGMRERALAFGGLVDFRSAKGRGTSVTVTIPLAGAEGREAGVASPAR
jgi:signal transduction histidine kinase